VLRRRRVINTQEGIFDGAMDRSGLAKTKEPTRADTADSTQLSTLASALHSKPSQAESKKIRRRSSAASTNSSVGSGSSDDYSGGSSNDDSDGSDDSGDDPHGMAQRDGTGHMVNARSGKKWESSNPVGLFPVANVSCSINSSTTEEEARRLYLGTWVTQVAVAHPDGPAIRQFRDKQESLLALRRSRARTLLHAKMDRDKWQATKAHAQAKGLPEPPLPAATNPSGGTLDLEANADAPTEHDLQRFFRPKDLVVVRELEHELVSSTKSKRKESLGDGSRASGMGLIGQAKMEKGNEDSSSEHRRKVLGAFVVFKHEESYAACLTEYAMSNVAGGGCCGILSLCMRYCQPKHLQFHGLYPLKVERASDPTDILWENFDTGATEKRARRCTGNCITFLLLLLSFGVSTVSIG
jgi:hypothetical protein